MGQKTHPAQLRAAKPLHSCWYSRSQYANILHYELGLRKNLSLPFHKKTSAGPVFTAWSARGVSLTLTYIPKSEDFSVRKGTAHNEYAALMGSRLSDPSLRTKHTNASQASSENTLRKVKGLFSLLHHGFSTPYINKKKGKGNEDLRFTQARIPHKGHRRPFGLQRPYGPEALWRPFARTNRAYGWWLQRVHAYSLESPYQTAQTTAALIAHRIEEGGKIRSILDTIIREAQNTASVQGIKVRIAGRLQGAEIASAQNKQWGTLGLHTLSQRVDYASARAHITAGIIGVQVWLSFRRNASPGLSFAQGAAKPFGP